MLTKWMIKEFLRIAAALLLGALLIGSQSGCAGEKLSSEQRAEHVAAFDQVWQTVEANHWDREMIETDWAEAREELRPEIEAAETERDARRVTNQLVGRLGQSHFGVIPRSVYERVETEGGDGTAGIRVRLRDGEGLVVYVPDDSPAQAAGVRPGDVVVRVGERAVADMIDAAEEASEHGVTRAETTFAGLIGNALSGEVGGTVAVTIRDTEGAERDVEIGLIEPEGELFGFGNLPKQRVDYRGSTLESGIGYFYLGGFFGPPKVMPAWQEFIEQHAEAPGLVLDLRSNPGGIMPMSTGMAGFLVEGKQKRLGDLTTRDSDLKMVINPRRGAFLGPVAVLIDEMSASNSEILAGGLQGLDRARIFGNTTAGLVLPARVEQLPTGDGFIYAFADYVSVSGDRLEGSGVEPDEKILERPAMFAGTSDPVLDAAVAWIQKQ